ncbi:hypothetical protein BDN72DRAFT_207567 [Pluteus cervinus]|uniref:Uncharacterized protein n=1 Tax=Pluteus cervinus TaxID=181527 RepID=A0ACD3AHP2_9AGAR|nr:hypothetical protein BDN72DRAFT_207567 [Pluteus cervinus]
MTTDARFPLELERIIFLMALQNRLSDAPNLFSVARRVHDWLVPKAFEVVVLQHRQSYPIGFTKDKFQRYGKHVRHLLISSIPVGFDSASVYISFCPHVQNLALWTGHNPTEIEAIIKLPLTHLSVNIDRMGPLSPPLLHLFSMITHLDVVGSFFSWDECASLIHFPILTHLAIFRGSLPAIVPLILEQLPQIQVLIWRGNSPDEKLKESEFPESSSFDDERLVCIECEDCEDWLNGARGGQDMWRFAESLVESRREG